MKRAFLLAAATALLLLPAIPLRASEPEIHITAKNWAFAPAVITLHVNQKTKLVFSASEGMHGITIPDLGVNDVVNIGTSPSEVEVTPTKVGTYVARCAIFCGAGHANMTLTIKVVK